MLHRVNTNTLVQSSYTFIHFYTHEKVTEGEAKGVSEDVSHLSCSKTFWNPPAHLLEDTSVRAIFDLRTYSSRVNANTVYSCLKSLRLHPAHITQPSHWVRWFCFTVMYTSLISGANVKHCIMEV